MSLYRTELRRLGKRRFTRWATLLGLLVLAAVLAGIFVTNEKIGPEQRARAERKAEQQYQEQARWAEEERAACTQAKTSGQNAPQGRYPEDCAMIQPPDRESIEAKWYLPSTFDFRDRFEETIIPFTGILAMIGFVVGASFVGAEWSTGGMMNLLLWRPKRLTVLLTKLAALLTGAVGLTVVTAALWTVGFWIVGTMRGSTAKMTAGVWQSFGLTGLRGLLLIVVAATLGFAIASLGRHTAMALGGAIGVVAVGQFGVGVLMGMAGAKFIEAWLLPTYAMAWLQKKVILENYDSCNANYYGECKPDTLELTWQHSSILLGVGLVVILGAALINMRRRDIA
ncbi:ABC transporter permease subunit [Micromonospora sp. DT233]|uniref:ABC transporter permease subunit n=1 Tax=Micromonospora sp. DT233 TaxID=3393432 RepID=UPI003CF1BBF9